MKSQTQSAASAEAISPLQKRRLELKARGWGTKRRDLLQGRGISRHMLASILPQSWQEQKRELPRMEVYWEIRSLTTRDLASLLEAFERSLTETAVEILISEGVPKKSLDAYKHGTGLLDIKVTYAVISSFKMRFEIEFSSKAKSEPWMKSVAKGVLKKVAIGWISAVIWAGLHQGDGGGSGSGSRQEEPAHPGAKSVPAMVASLAQTGKPSRLTVNLRGGKPARIQIGPEVSSGQG